MPKPDSGAAERTPEEITRAITGKDEEAPRDKSALEDDEDDETPKDEREDKETPAKKNGESDGPPPTHPRFNEVYGKMKAYERKLAERDADFEQLREHNRAMAERLEQVERSKADKAEDPAPDPDVDPAAYRKWVDLQREKDKEEDRKARAIDRHNLQVEMQRELHEDYDEVIKIAEREMQKDKEAHKKIWGSDNPAREGYKFGKKIKEQREKEEKEEAERLKTRSNMDVEKAGESGEAPAEEEVKLTDDQKRIIRNLWPELPYAEARKKYISQMKAMGRI